MRTRNRLRRFGMLLVMGAVATSASGCGARWTDEQEATVLARDQGGGGATAAGGATGTGRAPTGTASGTPAPGGGATPDSSGAPGGQAPGAAPGAAPAEGSGEGGPLPCAAPSDEQGVTDSQIVVGEISSLSGPVPGLGASAAAAARAYVAFRNATGGVCGREVVLREADDGTDSARYRSSLSELDPDVLGITGGFAVGDIGSEDLINQLGIPIVNTPTGRTGELPMVFDINPNFPQPDMLIGKYRYLYEQGARTVSMSYIAVDQSRIEANIQRALMEAAGLEIVHVNELPLSTLSYDAAARAAANSGANYLWFIADTNGQASMARSVDETGHEWLFKEFSYTTYGTNFIELAGEAAEGATSWIRSLPTEEASTNEAMATYVEYMNLVAPGLPQDLFSIDSWVGAKVFLESVEALPGPITREALVAQLASIESYDAGGMFAPINVGQDLSQGCFMAMIVRDGQWQRLAPEGGGYLC
jgi:branched-chain amino acid transport system substrate-binding protein